MDDPRKVLARHGLAAKKSWGQNFLHDRNVIERIVRAVAAVRDDVVVEIGAGLGTLTAALAGAEPRPRRIIAVERDPEMLAVLEAELASEIATERVSVVAGDAARFDWGAAAAEAGGRLVVVGNLPYQIASALILGIVQAGRAGAIARAVVMIQREMAERLVAVPGNRVYGRLTAMVGQYAEARVLFHVRPGSFHPAPQVISSVLALVPRPAPLAAVADAAAFEEVVKQVFATRRKMLRGTLARAFGEPASTAALAASGIAGTRRAEELSIAELARLTDALVAAGGVISPPK